MFGKKKDEKVDYESLNSILKIWKKISKIVYVVIIVLLVLLGSYIFKEWKIFQFLGELLKVISPIFIGLIVAWLFDPVVKYLQKRKIPRLVGCIIVYILLLGFIFLLIYSFFPTLIHQLGEFVSGVPAVLSEISDFINKIFQGLNGLGIKDKVFDAISNLGVELTTSLPTMVINAIKAIVSGSLTFLLGLMIGFYMLFDYDKLNLFIINNMPKSWKNNYQELSTRINTSLRHYVQGILLVMFLVFITQTIGLTLAGLKTPLLFALFCAVTDIIPYFGPYIGAIPAVLVGFTISPAVGVFTIIAIVIVQLIENNFYQPLIMGHTMKLHPVVIMVGVLIFQHFFGIIGMVVATPVIASVKVIFNFINEKVKIKNEIVKKKNELKNYD